MRKPNALKKLLQLVNITMMSSQPINYKLNRVFTLLLHIKKVVQLSKKGYKNQHKMGKLLMIPSINHKIKDVIASI